MKQARFVAVAAVLVAAVVVGLAPVVAADPADYPVTLFPSGAASPFSITRGPDGALWFTFSNATEFGNAIGRIDTAGNVTRFELPNPGSQPGYITAGPDGALWFTEEFGNRIGRITTTGSITRLVLNRTSSSACRLAGSDTATNSRLPRL